MKAMRSLTLAAALATAALLVQTMPASAWQENYPKLRFGVLSVESQGAALTRYEGFKEHVREKLGVELELFLASEYAGVIQAMASKQLEMAAFGASSYAAAYAETDGNVEPLVVAREMNGDLGYNSVLLVRADSPYQSIDDLKGKTFAWADPNSSSGYLFPLVSFRAQGLDPEAHFGRVVFSGGHEQSIIGLMDGAYDAIVTWTSDPVNHLRGGIRMMLDRGVVSTEDFRVIWVSDLIPNPPVAILSDLPEAMKADLRDLFLNLHEEASEEVFYAVARGQSPGFAAVDHSLFQIAVDLRQQLAADRRRR